MTEKELLDKMAYRHYEECRDFYMKNDPGRDFIFAERALIHFKAKKDESDWRWRSNEEYFSVRVGDLYSEYELERFK